MDFAPKFPDRSFLHQLMQKSVYRPEDEHDSCGVGLVAALDGCARREVVVCALEALGQIWHRGAVDADGKTGDGAGIQVEIPIQFMREHITRTGHVATHDLIGVGQIFLPRTDYVAQEKCRMIVEQEILRADYRVYGWRQVPINLDAIGSKAEVTRPEIEQIMIAGPEQKSDEPTDISQIFERDLYLIRRRIENAIRKENIADFYICSLSCRNIIYKGLFLAEQLSVFYPDLLDERFISRYALYHQRYSTNTFPSWWLAQPFRCLAHNGEINTIIGNRNWMKIHEYDMEHPVFTGKGEDLRSVIPPSASDSAALDSVFELLCQAGRPAPLVKQLLMPPAIHGEVDAHARALVEYGYSLMEPWDGPAALVATDGQWVIAGSDRNGLRPLRYVINEDNLLIAGSETGMVRQDESRISQKKRVGPGQMIAIRLKDGQFFDYEKMITKLSQRHPYAEWVKNIQRIEDLDISPKASERKQTGSSRCFFSPPDNTPDNTLLQNFRLAWGQSWEDMEMILDPMVLNAKEGIGSMGDDTPLAVLREKYYGLHHFFRQNFSQVTNPPIDSLRERRVMSLATRLNNFTNILSESPVQCQVLELPSPILRQEEWQRLYSWMGEEAVLLSSCYPPADDAASLRNALEKLCQEAEKAIDAGARHIVVSDQEINSQNLPIPMILAIAALHTHLVKSGQRSKVSLNCLSGEALDVHYMAVLIGVGATTITPWLSEYTIRQRWASSIYQGLDEGTACKNYQKALNEGLLKIMSKMGVAVISSYRGGYPFEALGLSRSLVATYFPGMISRISGMGLAGIASKAFSQHQKAFTDTTNVLPIGGFYRWRAGGETHAFRGEVIHSLQQAVTRNSFKLYKDYVRQITQNGPVHLRDLLDFVHHRSAINVEDVSSITQIRRLFVTPGMSLGALSPEAHGVLNVAMNRIGARSNSGEGGEYPDRFTPDVHGDNWNSAIKQVASGRFGVTALYLNNCQEIEIKVAQGAKPGEGGQLPAFKVSQEIASLRHATENVSLISPPPHHDIYSIEDLAQLIYDLKQINETAEITVKLVARSGIGTIAAGVAKANADRILISGHVGGTGASPHTSLKYAGIPWEMGLSEVHQILSLNNLRDRVVLRVDGGIRTGRDIVIAAILGAEEFGIGTACLVALGCLMVRQCHNNTCPVGICTQDIELRKHFLGKADHVINYFSFLAEDVRDILAGLGYHSLQEIIGRTELLAQIQKGADNLDDLDLNPLLVQPNHLLAQRSYYKKTRNHPSRSFDEKIIPDAAPFFECREKMQLTYSVRNTDRTIGTRLSSLITRKYGMDSLPDDLLTIRLRGSAGQSLGAFAVKGLCLEVFGDANDYVGKGLSGGKIILRPTRSSKLQDGQAHILGNTALYGATAGSLFALGQAGERFAVRNSGASAVIEGCGDNGCEYMTGGLVVILGQIGANFAAGMTGGVVFLYDPQKKNLPAINQETVIYRDLPQDQEERLREILVAYEALTQSPLAQKLLYNWSEHKGSFRQIIPKEILALQQATTKEKAANQA